MEFLKSAIFGMGIGAVEGLPISSCGHVLLFKHIFGQGESLLTLLPILYVGVLIAIICVYYKLIWYLAKAFFKIFADVFTRRFSFNGCDQLQNMALAIGIGVTPLFFIFFPVVGSGTNILGIIREFSDENNVILLGLSFLINGVLLRLGANNLKSDKYRYTYKTSDNVTRHWEGRKKFTIMDAIWCGAIYFASMIFPGVSHIGAVFSIGIIRGINKKIALDYSFLLGIPLLLIILLSEVSLSVRFGGFSNFNIYTALVGVLFSLIFGFLFIKVFKRMVEKNKISIFAFYNFVFGVSLLAIGIFEEIKGVNVFQGTIL